MSITTPRGNGSAINKVTHEHEIQNLTADAITAESSSNLFTIFVVAVVVFLLILIMSVIKWFIKERRLRELRHRLIPMYTFDPNDEDDWDSELLCQDQSIVVQKAQDYNSVHSVEDNDSSATRQNLI